MLSQFRYGLLFAVLIGASLSAVATAGAATATITNGPNVTGTATTPSLLQLHTASKTLSCDFASFNGTVAASSTGSIPPGFRVGTVTPVFHSCTIVGGLGITVTCQPSALNVNSVTTAGSTKASISGLSCHIFVTTQTGCRITIAGAVGATFMNSPATMPTDTNHQSLSATNSTNGTGSACAVLPNTSSVRLTSWNPGDLQYNVSPISLSVNVTP